MDYVSARILADESGAITWGEGVATQLSTRDRRKDELGIIFDYSAVVLGVHEYHFSWYHDRRGNGEPYIAENQTVRPLLRRSPNLSSVIFLSA